MQVPILNNVVLLVENYEKPFKFINVITLSRWFFWTVLSLIPNSFQALKSIFLYVMIPQL